MKKFLIPLLVVIISIHGCTKEEEKNISESPEILKVSTLIYEENFDDKGDWQLDTIWVESSPPGGYMATEQPDWKFKDGVFSMNAWEVRVLLSPVVFQQKNVVAYKVLDSIIESNQYKIEVGIVKFPFFESGSTDYPTPHNEFWVGGIKFEIGLNEKVYLLHGDYLTYGHPESGPRNCGSGVFNAVVEYTLDSTYGLLKHEKNGVDSPGCIGVGGWPDFNYIRIEAIIHITGQSGDNHISPQSFAIDYIKIYSLE